jgi:hypothetical protein
MAARGDDRKRSGDFSATGEFKWYALAEEPGAIQKENGYEVLDLRKKASHCAGACTPRGSSKL